MSVNNLRMKAFHDFTLGLADESVLLLLLLLLLFDIVLTGVTKRELCSTALFV